ncbi:hypothetical protein AQUCO_01400106v1 [Aquilegia coerulea]|uniref:N-lysine methyltransferase n=1 Tax=Aquilegia coerulea TaxID=218851 RepID=A0A2G5DUL0_AQUCA|nr:hypothetical protein AQUCO_01400106v1 [Aquilegia coerulea]
MVEPYPTRYPCLVFFFLVQFTLNIVLQHSITVTFAAMSRRLRAFKRWMNSQKLEWSSTTLELVDNGIEEGILVKAICDLNEGDVIAKIPKNACLTIKTSAAREMIEDAGLAGSLGLSVAVMYEKSLGEESLWSGYLQLLPDRECVPLVWTLDEVDKFLAGTELHKIVKDDKALMYEDWKECIFPLIESGPMQLDPKYFGAEQYFAAKSLVFSRSFEIDDYHGYGMVPFADLFNHKTGAENVHFTSVSSPDPSSDDNSDVEDNERQNNDHDESSIEDVTTCRSGSPTALDQTEFPNSNEMDLSSNSEGDSDSLEMIIVKEVKAGNEVFNTYGSMGNAALLHRYGFTEPNNTFDIVNIELNLVLDWSLSLFTSRYFRARLSLWRRIGYSGCVSQDVEYFEISSDGEPQFELLILLYIIFLPDEVYYKLNHTLPSNGSINKPMEILLLDKRQKRIPLETPEMAKEYLLTDEICGALISLADSREASYGTNPLSDDIMSLSTCSMRDRKLYHSSVLRVRERKILQNLRTYASSRSHQPKKGAIMKKR